MSNKVVRYISERGASPWPNTFGVVSIFAEFSDQQREQVRQVVWHSPTGLEYGYGGSGPADTAISILAHWYGIDPIAFAVKLKGTGLGWEKYTDDEHSAVRLHQTFKFKLVGSADRELPLIIYRREIELFLVEHNLQGPTT